MDMKSCKYAKLIEYRRGNIIDQEHSGVIIHINKHGVINKVGEDNEAEFCFRSCMKPLQAAAAIDLELDKKYNFSLDEIALFCASHTGDLIHREKILSILKKIGCNSKDLLCPELKPLSLKEQKRLIQNNLSFDKIHNNCSGKHSMMLAICKDQNFPLENYKDFNHPLTKLILTKVCELCEINLSQTIITKDGCGLPVIAASIENLAKGILNLFSNKKYEKIKQAFIQFPFLIGGEGRLDSEIINASAQTLAAKVGAGGLCVVVNLEKEEAIAVKIADANMEARSFAVLSAIEQLKWPKNSSEFFEHIYKIYKKDIVSQDGEILGKISPCFKL